MRRAGVARSPVSFIWHSAASVAAASGAVQMPSTRAKELLGVDDVRSLTLARVPARVPHDLEHLSSREGPRHAEPRARW